MSNEFYSFIAKKIISYFQGIGDNINPGESYCLKLDDEIMVTEVTMSMEHVLEENGNKGIYTYICQDGSVYNTFTIRLSQYNEIIVGAQINGMSNDFLCATLRNVANEKNIPLLMISFNPIDSAISGTRDMMAVGMPFYYQNIISDIEKIAKKTKQLSDFEKDILEYELSRRKMDVFSDKSSLFEYEELLSIISKGRIDDSDFEGLRLLRMDAKNAYKTCNKRQRRQILVDNSSAFEKIDDAMQKGNLEKHLSADYVDSFIVKLEKARNNDVDHWSRKFSLDDIIQAQEKQQKKKGAALKIADEDIIVCVEECNGDYIQLEDNVFIRDVGSQTSKKHLKSILIFDSDKFGTLNINIKCNIRIPLSSIKHDRTILQVKGKQMFFTFEHPEQGIDFYQLKIEDTLNRVSYVFNICLLEIASSYIIDTIKTGFVVDYKAKKKNSSIKILDINCPFCINQQGINEKHYTLVHDLVCDCAFNEKIYLESNDEDTLDWGKGVPFKVNFSGVIVPFKMFPNEEKSSELTGKTILKTKFLRKESILFDGDKRLYTRTQEYFVRGELLHELQLEYQIINEGIIYGQLETVYEGNGLRIVPFTLEIDTDLKAAYFELLNQYKQRHTVPSLAYIDDELFACIEHYLVCFKKCFENLKQMNPLSKVQEDSLLIGMLVGALDNELSMTPLHPVNMAYQLALRKEKEIGLAEDIVIERLHSAGLIPFLQRNKIIYKVATKMNSLEWKYYAPAENKKFRGGRSFVPKLIEEKISEYIANFKYLFTGYSNRTLKINLINMGDCGEVFEGIVHYYIHCLKRNLDIEQLIQFEVNVYTSSENINVFRNLRYYESLRRYLNEIKLSLSDDVAMYSLEGILAKNINCYFHSDKGCNYAYAHISFYEMESEVTLETAAMNQIETGVSLGGILSGVPSSKYGQKYRTGYGSKYSEDNELLNLAELYNSLMVVSGRGNPYQSEVAISTQIDVKAESKMEYIYQKSNWVVFIDPKVDLEFFYEKEAKNDLLIIHYSDQYTSSSGYDAITVTRKSKQYTSVINEYLSKKGLISNSQDTTDIINLFNAINGNWLLKMISPQKRLQNNQDSTFSREKISIVAAIKFMLAYLKHDDILWVPISLEELLRVSIGAGLSQRDGILSAKNLGFEKGATCDDLLFIGIYIVDNSIKISFYPTEVKTGNNEADVIEKAFIQVTKTIEGLANAMNGAENDNTISAKIYRNFMMQLVIISCKKMQIYHVDDSQDWDLVLDRFRLALLNEKYSIVANLNEILGYGAVLSFKKASGVIRNILTESNINFIELPEQKEFDFILDSVSKIKDTSIVPLREAGKIKSFDLNRTIKEDIVYKTCCDEYLSQKNFDFLISEATADSMGESIYPVYENLETNKNELSLVKECIERAEVNAGDTADIDMHSKGIKVFLGINQQNGERVYWEPNNTSMVFHPNTGIIGTMGTGKTQFTRSLITQLSRKQKDNLYGSNLGILIFDYKGDYNNTKPEFVKATGATVIEPYHLPFNPFSVSGVKNTIPLLPKHRANAFVDTISRSGNLGPKQKNSLFKCIITAYEQRGIIAEIPSTWDNLAPTFEDVYSVYQANEDIKKNDTLAAVMEKLHQFEVFESDPAKAISLYELLDGVVVINLQDFDEDMKYLITGITLDLFYIQMQNSGSSRIEGKYRQLTKMILADEADNFMSSGFPALKKVLKEGREFGVGVILSTQSLEHFCTGEDDYSKYIWTWIAHNVSDLTSANISYVFRTEPRSAEEQILFNDIKKLEAHHSIVKIGTKKHIYIEDYPFWRLVKDIESDLI